MNGCTCDTDGWTAVLNIQPPEPPRMNVHGIVTCPTGGFRVSLQKAVPQGVDPSELLLEVVALPPTGIVNQLITPYAVSYHEENSHRYATVRVVPCNIAIDVEVVV